MINLLHAEFYKLRKSSFIKISFIICTICAICMAVVSNQVQAGNISQSVIGSASGLSEAMVISLLGSFIIGIIVSVDFESKSIHAEISSSKGRMSVVIVKIIMAFVSIFILMIPYAITTLIAYATDADFSKLFVTSAFTRILSSGVEVSSSSIGKIIALSIALVFVYTAKLSICVPLAFKIKKPAIIMAIGFTLSGFVDFLVGLIEKDSFLDKVIKWTPFYREYGMVGMDTETGVMIRGIIISVVFIVIIGFITYRLFRKAEIK